MKMPLWWIERRITRLENERLQLGVRYAEYVRYPSIVYYFDEAVKAKERIALINVQLHALYKMKFPP